MESNWKIHFTLCTRNRRTKTMVINCEYGLKTSIDNDFSARIKKIKKKLCADRDSKSDIQYDNAHENLHKTVSDNLTFN